MVNGENLGFSRFFPWQTQFYHVLPTCFDHFFATCWPTSPSSPSTWPALEPRSSARHHQSLRSDGTPGIHGFLLKLDEQWMKKNVMYAIVRPIHHPWRLVRNSKFESSYVIMFLFQLAIFWETLLLCGFALLVGHDATTHEVTLQGPPVIVDHLKVEIIALLIHGFPRIPMLKRQDIPTWPRGFSMKHDETWWNMMKHDETWWNHVIVLNIVKIYMNPCFAKSGRGVFSKARRKLEADSAGGSW